MTSTATAASETATAGGKTFKREARPAARPVNGDGETGVVNGGVTGAMGREQRKPERSQEVNVDGRVFTREVSTSSLASADPLSSIPRSEWPSGVTYQWKRESTVGQTDEANLKAMQRLGWQFVPADRHPGHLVRYEGLVLMEIPTVWLNEMEKADRDRAGRERFHAQPEFQPHQGIEVGASVGNLRGARIGPAEATDPGLRPALTIDE